jgi:hypothetical protein
MHRLFIVKPANRSLILKEVTGARVQQGVAGGITLLLIKLNQLIVCQYFSLKT